MNYLTVKISFFHHLYTQRLHTRPTSRTHTTHTGEHLALGARLRIIFRSIHAWYVQVLSIPRHGVMHPSSICPSSHRVELRGM